MAAIRETFFQECEEQLAALEAGLLAMETGDTDPETVNAVFRAVHSVKGGAGAFGLDALVRFAHVFETTLDSVRAGRLAPNATLLKLMLRSADALSDLIRAARDNLATDEERYRLLAAELSGFVAPPEAAPKPAAAAPPVVDDLTDGFDFKVVPFDFGLPVEIPGQAWLVRFRPRAELYAKANETAVLLRELSRLGPLTVELDATALPMFSDVDPEGAYLAWNIRLATAQSENAIRDVFGFVDEDCELDVRLAEVAADLPADAPDVLCAALSPSDELAVVAQPLAEGHAEPDAKGAASLAASPAIASPAGANSPGASPAAASGEAHGAAKATIRVDLDRVDRLVDLVGELVINQAMLAQRVLDAGLARHSNVALGFNDLEQLTRDIQDSVMAIRAQPVKSVFQRMPRLVREVAAMTGKRVRLVTEGENTEVDKTVIEHLADPLTHMIRNAVDHGLESPDERSVAGKSAEGTVRLTARHRSGRIIIEVGDDGAGISRPRVRASATAKGLITPEATLSDEEIDNLIFMPGFSTASEISDISGRGVGMDVVKRSVQALGGRITIASQPGQGSTFIMSLPLTLAVLDGMVVTVAGQTLVVPLTAITETLQPRACDVHSLGSGAMVIAIRGSYVPLLDVGTALGYRDEELDPTAGIALLVEGEGGTRAALLVDAIQGQRQVVIKSLEANYRRIPGVAAATILGDGRVALILDVDAVVTASRAGPGRMEKPAYGARACA